MKDLFAKFDFTLLDSPEFKEDAVREELISPLLNALGYTASSQHRIIRSKSLEHPFVSIGTTERKIHIIPDYLLQINGENCWVLDAKRPTENILKGKNPEQAYSYAIHRDVRVHFYALCNGKEFVLFHISEIEPILYFGVKDLENSWDDLYKCLSPMAFINPASLHYSPDWGVHLNKMGIGSNVMLHFLEVQIPMIARVRDDLYTISAPLKFDNEQKFMISFDFTKEQYEELISFIPDFVRQKMTIALSQQPYNIFFKDKELTVWIEARLSEQIHRNEEESYLPLQVYRFRKSGPSLSINGERLPNI